MGWLSGWRSKDELVEHIQRDMRTATNYEVVGKSALRGNNLWSLLQRKDDPAQRIILLHMLSSEGGEWGYKSLSEDSFPYQTNCPIKMLQASTCPNDSWRRHALIVHENERLAKGFVKPGEVLLYGQRQYRMDESLGAKGWRVHCLQDEQRYRMSAQQIAKAALQTVMSHAKTLFNGEIQTSTLSWEKIGFVTQARWANRALNGAQTKDDIALWRKDTCGVDHECINLVARCYVTPRDEGPKASSPWLESDAFEAATGGVSSLEVGHKIAQEALNYGPATVRVDDAPTTMTESQINALLAQKGLASPIDIVQIRFDTRRDNDPSPYSMRVLRELSVNLQELNGILHADTEAANDRVKAMQNWVSTLVSEHEDRERQSQRQQGVQKPLF